MSDRQRDFAPLENSARAIAECLFYSLIAGLAFGLVSLFLLTTLSQRPLKSKKGTVDYLPSQTASTDLTTVSQNLPEPNKLLTSSKPHSYQCLRGIKLNPQDPFRLEFIIDTQDKKEISQEELSMLIKYFLAALTIPEEELWVNLSPYEPERIIPESLGLTDLGKDLLSQDYLLKQLVASLIYPESNTGRKFWEKTYQEVFQLASTTNIPINTFNKVWIIPEKAEVYEKGGLALITDARLEVMLEEDYLALKNSPQTTDHSPQRKNKAGIEEINKIGSQRLKELILPEIKDEVNKGENFAKLRQMYYSLILATWFKQRLKDTFYQYYIDQKKLKGIDIEDPSIKEKIYNLYLESFKRGVYNYIKVETEPYSRKRLKRRYYSGGIKPVSGLSIGNNLRITTDKAIVSSAMGKSNEINKATITIHPKSSQETNRVIETEEIPPRLPKNTDNKVTHSKTDNENGEGSSPIKQEDVQNYAKGRTPLITEKDQEILKAFITDLRGGFQGVVKENLIFTIVAILTLGEDEDMLNKTAEIMEKDSLAEQGYELTPEILMVYKNLRNEDKESFNRIRSNIIIRIAERGKSILAQVTSSGKVLLDYYFQQAINDLKRLIDQELDERLKTGKLRLFEVSFEGIAQAIEEQNFNQAINILTQLLNRNEVDHVFTSSLNYMITRLAQNPKDNNLKNEIRTLLLRKVSSSLTTTTPGGIDLNPQNLPLSTTSSPLQFNLSPETLQLWQQAEGITFRILTIEPVANLERLLGPKK